MMNFDRNYNANQFVVPIEELLQSFYLQRAKQQIFEYQTCEKKIIVFLDTKIPVHKELLSYYQRNHSKKWSAMNPCLYFEFYYNFVVTTLLKDDLTFLHEYIDNYLSSNQKSSKSIDEKESESNPYNNKINLS